MDVIITLISMKGGDFMREVFDFIIAVAAGAVGNWLCKWLDGKRKDDN